MAKPERILIGIIACLLSVFVFFLCINGTVFSKGGYVSDFTRLGVYERFGAQADSLNAEVLLYLQGERNLTTPFFSAREKDHLADVRALFELMDAVSGALIIFLALFAVLLQRSNPLQFLRNMGKILLVCAAIGIGLVSVIGALALLDFSGTFLAFHTLFFDEGTYLFDPANENIVNLYPEGLFFSFALRIALFSLVAFVLLGALGFVLIKVPLKNNKLFKRKKRK